MIRRLVISLFLIFAFALLQAHNFIPHHHHEITAESGHHHHHDEDDNDDHKSGHEFPDFDHSVELGKVVTKPQVVREVLQKPVIDLHHIFWLSDQVGGYESPPVYNPPDNDSPLHRIFLSHSLPLRAPPSLSFARR
jgi:hypothetical protein